MILELRHVSRVFGGLRANHDVSFSVPQGSIVGLIGPNGAGKTTLFNCITGFTPPSSGEVIFEGKPVHGLSPDKICKLGLTRTWQKVRPLASLTALDNVVVGALLRAPRLKDARALAMQQLERVRLAHQASAPAGALPIGERKKLEVARALATGPRMLLLDEVLGGLNAVESEDLIALMLELKKTGLTQLVIEHDMKAIMRISDRVVVLNSGELLADSTPVEVSTNPAVVAAYLGDALAEG